MASRRAGPRGADHGSLVRSCLRRPDDFARVARELVADEAAGGTRWPEVTFTAASHGERFGVRALEDAELTARLRDTGVPLEVCPSSNVGLGVVPSFAGHPLPTTSAPGCADHRFSSRVCVRTNTRDANR